MNRELGKSKSSVHKKSSLENVTQQFPTINQEIVTQLLALFELSKKDQQALVDCNPYILSSIDSIIEEFYDYQLQHPEIKNIIGKDEVLVRLKIKMYKYIQDLFSGEYGIAYVLDRMRIGKVHDQMEVAPRLYLASTTQLLVVISKYINNVCSNTMDAAHLERCQYAITKLLLFDAQIVLGTYYDTLTKREERAKDELNRYVDLLEEKNKLLDNMSRKDMLTNLYNSRAFTENLQREYSNARRNLYPLSILYMDLNNFKKANDEEGHQAGDEILKLASGAMVDATRDTDIVCRIGGDEFCIILPNALQEDAIAIGNRVMNIFDQLPRRGVTMSLGVAQTGPKEFIPMEKFIKIADDLMYKAKEKSRSLPSSQMEVA